MADCSDVEQALVSVLVQALYPNGTAAASATGERCKVYRGWPDPVTLDADLSAGVVNVSVFPLDGEQNVTRYGPDWLELPTPPVTLALTVAAQTITVGGTPRCPLNAAALVNGSAFVYPLQATDTPTTVATALAALINAVTPASNTGPVVTVPGATRLQARTGPVGALVHEVKRQKKGFRITTWCRAPHARDAVARIVDPALGARTFLTLCDGTAGRVRYERTHVDDTSQKSRLYRRDLVYSVEYGTTQTRKAAAVVAETVALTGGLDPSAPPLSSISF